MSNSPDWYEGRMKALEEEVERLRVDRDLWMERSNAHAITADRFRVDCINLKGHLFHEKGTDRGDE